MAYVICVCGAGGKTTYCMDKALQYSSEKRKVCVLTSTHMWYEKTLSDINELSNIEVGKIYFFGTVEDEKVTRVSDDDYKKICDVFDYVIVETDGSRMMPLKIPHLQSASYDIDDKNKVVERKIDKYHICKKFSEPVIYNNVNEIVIVMGLEAIGREFNSVTYNAKDIDLYFKKQYIDEMMQNERSIETRDENTHSYKHIVTEKLIDDIIEKCYVEPLKNEFKDAVIKVHKTDFSKSANYKNIKKLVLILCASGFSKRFGKSNKLFIDIKKSSDRDSIILYKHMIEKLISSKDLLLKKFRDDLSYDLKVDISIVSQYDEILIDNDYKDKVIMIRNTDAKLGLSSSIRCATKNFIDYDAMMFLNADLPLLPEKEIALFLYHSICSNDSLSSMYTDMPQNPAYFENKYFDEILDIEGDIGPKDLLKKYKKHCYKYHIDKKYLYDIDTVDDYKNLWNV